MLFMRRRWLSSISESLRNELAQTLATRRQLRHDQAEAIITSFGTDPSIVRSNVDSILDPGFPKSALTQLEEAGRAELARQGLSVPGSSGATVSVRVPGQFPGARDTAFTIKGHPGQSLKDLAASNEELGELLECACGGNMTCSTCHVYLDPDSFEQWGGRPSEEEQDMLDIAFEPKDGASRLGCQIRLKRGVPLGITIPSGVVNHFR